MHNFLTHAQCLPISRAWVTFQATSLLVAFVRVALQEPQDVFVDALVLSLFFLAYFVSAILLSRPCFFEVGCSIPSAFA